MLSNVVLCCSQRLQERICPKSSWGDQQSGWRSSYALVSM